MFMGCISQNAIEIYQFFKPLVQLWRIIYNRFDFDNIKKMAF